MSFKDILRILTKTGVPLGHSVISAQITWIFLFLKKKKKKGQVYFGFDVIMASTV